MANKQLTATVRFNVSQAEKSIDRLVNKINKISNALNKTTNNNVEKQLNRSSSIIDKIKTKTQEWANKNKKVEDSAKRINDQYKKSGSLVSMINGKIKRLIGTYLGVLGLKGTVKVSDKITSSENKLNYISAINAGESGINADGSYSNATLKTTQQIMDKMYAGSKKVRMEYTDMMSNVSKSMALASGAFKNNTDNAIRFQEVMAEAYAVGGASADEMSTSMYQLIQALGSGVLAGDELRSVREGAPIAYQAIEQFAQGIYHTDESLKQLAADGKITSDIVVAAILDAGNQMDSAFNQTSITFDQLWAQIKSAATYAFIPVSNSLNEMLNKAVENGMVQKFETLFYNIAQAILVIFNVISKGIDWIANNWYWLQYIVYAVLTAIIIHLGIMAAQAVITGIKSFIAFLTGLSPLYLWIIVIGMVVAAIVWLSNTAVSGCEFIVYALTIVAAGLVLIGLLTGSTALIIAATIIAAIGLLLAVFYKWGDTITEWIYKIGAGIYNFFTGWIDGIIQYFYSRFVEPIAGIIEWFVNAFNGGFTSVGGGIQNFIGQLLSAIIGLVKPFAKLLDKVFGWDVNSMIESAQTNMKDWGKNETAVTYKVEAPTVSSMAGALGFNLPDRISYTEAGELGKKHGAIAQEKLGELGNNIKDKVSDFNLLESVGNVGKVISDKFSKFKNANVGTNKFGSSNFPDISDPAYALTTTPIEDLLSNIDDNVGDISDSMDLTNDDLEYLRKIAGMEWRNEFTTAEIKVDMTNHNNINGERDWDGMLTYLSDKLHEEMINAAYGVHA